MRRHYLDAASFDCRDHFLFRPASKAYNYGVLDVSAAQSPKHLVRLAGDYDLTRRDELAMLFARLDGLREIVIDMREVTYIDSTVLRELAGLHLRDPRRSVSLVGVKDSIRRVLGIVGFDRFLTIA